LLCIKKANTGINEFYIFKLLIHEMRWGDMAVLFRIRNVASDFEKQLKELGIPFTAVGKVPLADREEVKDILV
jgi:superfamily I DNA/RNA helicase